MSRSILTNTLQWLHPKDEDRNLISASFYMVAITLITMSMVNLTWFTITGADVNGDIAPRSLTLGQFFSFGYTNGNIDYSEYEYLTTTIVNMMRTTILLCFMAIIFSLAGFFLDIIGPRSILYRLIRKYAVPGTCTVLGIMLNVGVSYYVVLLLGDSLGKLYPKIDFSVSYGYGFYLLIGAGAVTLVGIFYNLILAQHPSGYYRDDDRCLIDGFDDGLDTFNSPTPPPPYNLPPPPYSP